MHTYDTWYRTETPSRTVAGKEANPSGSLFVVAIPYRDIFMTDIFAAADLVAILPASCKPRRKNLALGGCCTGRGINRSRQETIIYNGVVL